MHWTEKIERLQDERGFSLRSLETRAGLVLSTLPRDIRDRRNIGVDKGIKLAQALGVSADWLFDEEQGWPPPSTALSLSADDPRFTQAVRAALLQMMLAGAGLQPAPVPAAQPSEFPFLDAVEVHSELGRRLLAWARERIREEEAAKAKAANHRPA